MSRRVQRRDLHEKVAVGIRVRQDMRRRGKGTETLFLHAPCGIDAQGDVARVFARRRQRKVGSLDRRNIYMDVDTIKHGAGDFRLVIGNATRRLVAGERSIVHMPAAAGVHGGDQLEFGRKGHVVIGAADERTARLERLAQGFERLPLEFGQLVEEQHAVMRERYFPRLRAHAAADDGGRGGRMVRIAERARLDEPSFFKAACDGMYHRDFQRFGRGKRRQDARKTRRQHRLARTRRADHKQVVPARRRDFQRAFGAFLPLHVGKVELCAVIVRHLRLRAREHLRALHVIEKRNKVRGREHLKLSRPDGFTAASFGADDATFIGRSGNGGRQNARDGADTAVERQFAEHREFGKLFPRKDAHGRQHAERDGKIEMAAFLRDIRGREVDRDAFRRNGQADSM